MRMRSNLGGHYAGLGMKTTIDDIDDEEVYRNHSVLVRLEHDYVGLDDDEFEELCRNLSSEVITYKVKEVKK